MKSGKMLVGLLSGAAAGAALGLLFAPKKGTETRRAITRTGDNYLQDAKRNINEFSDSISHKVHELTNRTKAGLGHSKNKTQAQIHEMKAS